VVEHPHLALKPGQLPHALRSTDNQGRRENGARAGGIARRVDRFRSCGVDGQPIA